MLDESLPITTSSGDSAHPASFSIPIEPNGKRVELRVLEATWKGLLDHLLNDGEEHAAALICGVHETDENLIFLVREADLFVEDDYLRRGSLHLAVAPSTIARVAKRARAVGCAVVVVHSHPFSGHVQASSVDLRTEADLCRRVLTSRTGKPAAALVVGPGGLDGRGWTAAGASPLDTVRVIGDNLFRLQVGSQGVQVPSGSEAAIRETASLDQVSEGSATARQELLWGSEGQRLLRESSIVIVGVGGTGSHVATQLAHLRVGELTLIDHDHVEVTNLSRIIGLGPEDIGRMKARALADRLQRINPEALIRTVEASVLDVDPSTLAEADLIICATDGHGSRSLLNAVAHQYYVPVVDLGVEVVPYETFRAGGGVRVLRPGRACLWCAQTLSARLVREEYLTDAERAREVERGYLRDSTVAAPSVVALNGVVASLAVLEVCQLLVGVLGSGKDRLLYRAEQRALSTGATSPQDGCHVCGPGGVVGRGDEARVATRWRNDPSIGA